MPKGLSKDVVGRISRKIGCRCVLDESRCVLDESQKAWEPVGMQVNITCSNRFSSLVDEDECVGSEPNVDVVRREACEGQRVRFARKLKVATWNFEGLCSERKQKEISAVLVKCIVLLVRLGVVEKANADFEANKKEFWSFVGRRTKGRKGGVEALRNDSGVSVTSKKGKLKVLQSHYQRLRSCSVDDAFDDNWKQDVDSKVNECHTCSVVSLTRRNAGKLRLVTIGRIP